jgi:hypothetical protein
MGVAHIVEIGRRSYPVSEAANRHHPRPVDWQHRFEQQAREREVTEMICTEL